VEVVSFGQSIMEHQKDPSLLLAVTALAASVI
jgi:hypothetical protein